MKFKIRYLFYALCLLAYGGCQMRFFQFRTSEPELRTQLEAAGQKDAQFLTYEFEGRKMHYVHAGHDSLPLLIMVHGSPGSANNMLGYLSDKKLLDNFQVVAVDRPGFGWSDFGETEPSVGKQAADIRPIIERHGKKNAVLIGHSFGGPVISKMAMDYPDEVAGLIIVAGSIAPELEPKKWFQKPADWWIFRWILPPAVKVCNQEILPLPEELEAMMPDWEKITCPVTVVQGMEDNLVHPGNAEFAERMLVNSEKVILDTLTGQNHFILWSHQNLIVDHAINMLNEIESDD